VTELRFACDAMLGRLARWLRLAGLDASFDASLTGPALAGRAREEGRWLLTRNRRLAALAGPRVVLLHGAGVAGQIHELRRRLPVAASPERFLSRCSVCNGDLAPAAREAVAGLVPPYVAVHAARFLRCAGCGRVYWSGSHAAAIARRLEAWFGA
jgi:uncharacterized protein